MLYSTRQLDLNKKIFDTEKQKSAIISEQSKEYQVIQNKIELTNGLLKS